MATKKQKRERGEQKYREFMEAQRQSGLIAQKKDREYREKKRKRDLEDND
jgi:hypothetical protein